MNRSILALPFAALLLINLTTRAAAADAPKRQCMDAFEAGQRSQMSGDLKLAVEKFESCTVPRCPTLVQRECSRRLSAALDVVQTAEFEARFAESVAKGAVAVAAEATEEDKPTHNVQEPIAAPPKEEQTPAREEPKNGVPVTSWLVGGVNVVSVGGFVLLSSWGRNDNDRLAASCGRTGSCLQSSVDHVKNTYLLADVSLGVGVVALGGALLAYALNGPRSDERRPEQAAYHLHVTPARSGAIASFSGSF